MRPLSGSGAEGNRRLEGLLDPVIVTKENAADAYANDPKLSPLTK